MQGLMVESAYGNFFRQDTAWMALSAPRAQHFRGPWTSIVSHWCPISRTRNYYHWLFDALPRLSLLKYFPSSLRILIPGVLPHFARDSLSLLGLEGRYKIVSHPHVLIDDYFYSGLVGMTGCYNPYAVRYLRASFMPHGRLRNLPRCFFVGRRQPNRSIQNNAEVEAYFRNRGWSVLYLEDLSFQEQISLFKNAQAVCALHGAALANLVWCRPETYVLEMFADNYLHGAYEGIARINHLDYRSVVFKANRNRRPLVNLDILNFHLKDCPS